MNPRVFLDFDPRTLRLPNSRRSRADPLKLHRQIAAFGKSVQGMPPLEVSQGSDGALVLNNGVTRATRVAMLLQGTLVRVEVTDILLVARFPRPLPVGFVGTAPRGVPYSAGSGGELTKRSSS